jgi:Protein of unknown function (DUF3237)
LNVHAKKNETQGTTPMYRLRSTLLMTTALLATAALAQDDAGMRLPVPGIGYARTNPQFHAPQGKYEWLNKTLFVGTITPSTKDGAVIIRVFSVL